MFRDHQAGHTLGLGLAHQGDAEDRIRLNLVGIQSIMIEEIITNEGITMKENLDMTCIMHHMIGGMTEDMIDTEGRRLLQDQEDSTKL